MRVALCAPYDRSQVSGVSAFLNDFEPLLTQRGHIVFSITPDRFPVLQRIPRGFRSAALAIFTFSNLVRTKAKWDAIHVNQPHLQALAGIVAARICRAGSVVTYHSHMPPAISPLAALMQRETHRILGKYADARTFVAEALKRQLGNPGDRVVYLGVSPAVFEIRPSRAMHSSRKFTFVFSGRQTQSKGFFDLMKAVQQLRKRIPANCFRLILMGDAPEEERPLRDRWVSTLSDCIEDRGRLSDRKAVLDVYASADCIVLPSYREGLPVVLMDAMALGCVPIATSVDGIPELVQSDENGWLIRPGDSDLLTDRMAQAAQDRELVARMSERARTSVLRRFRLDRTVDQYLKIYALARSRGRRETNPASRAKER